MTKNRFASFLGLFISKSTFIIIFILCAIISFGVIATINGSHWIAKNENYLLLERTAYDMIEKNNFFMSLPEGLNGYDISVNSDGTADFYLHNNGVENLSIKISEDGQIQSLKRYSDTFDKVFDSIAISMLIGLVVCIVIYVIFFTPIIIYIIIKYFILKQPFKY